MEALEARTSRLPTVEIVRRDECLAKTTVDSLQSGLYFGTLGQVKEICGRITEEAFAGRKPKLIGTGGFSSLFSKSELFDVEHADLVLNGLQLALKMNA
jgi:type III pantothenate kinase